MIRCNRNYNQHTTKLYNSGVIYIYIYTANNHQNDTKYATSVWTPLLNTSSNNFNLPVNILAAMTRNLMLHLVPQFLSFAQMKQESKKI